MIRLTLDEIKNSEVYALAEKTWLKPVAAGKRPPDVDAVVAQIYQLIGPGSAKESQNWGLASLEYLRYLEKYVVMRLIPFFTFFFVDS
jgi:hypothetical protein